MASESRFDQGFWAQVAKLRDGWNSLVNLEHIAENQVAYQWHLRQESLDSRVKETRTKLKSKKVKSKEREQLEKELVRLTEKRTTARDKCNSEAVKPIRKRILKLIDQQSAFRQVFEQDLEGNIRSYKDATVQALGYQDLQHYKSALAEAVAGLDLLARHTLATLAGESTASGSTQAPYLHDLYTDSSRKWVAEHGLPGSPEALRRTSTGLSNVSNASDFSLGLKRAPGNYRRSKIYGRRI